MIGKDVFYLCYLVLYSSFSLFIDQSVFFLCGKCAYFFLTFMFLYDSTFLRFCSHVDVNTCLCLILILFLWS